MIALCPRTPSKKLQTLKCPGLLPRAKNRIFIILKSSNATKKLNFKRVELLSCRELRGASYLPIPKSLGPKLTALRVKTKFDRKRAITSEIMGPDSCNYFLGTSEPSPKMVQNLGSVVLVEKSFKIGFYVGKNCMYRAVQVLALFLLYRRSA